MPAKKRRRLALAISLLLLAALALLVIWIFWSGAHERLLARNQFDDADVAQCAALDAALSTGFPDNMELFQRELERMPDRERLVFYRIDRKMPDGTETRHELSSGEWQADSAVWHWDAETTLGRVMFTSDQGGPSRPALQYYRANDSLRVFVMLLER